MHALDIVSAADGTWSLRPLGAELDDDRYTEVLSLDTATGRTAVGIVGLLDAVRPGGAGHAATFGRSFTDLVDADPALSRSRLHSELAEWTATPLAASALLRDVTDIRVAGPGSGDIARAVRAHHPEARVRLLVPPSQARAAADLAAGDTGAGAGAGEIVVETGGLLDRRPELAEAYLLVGALAEFGDDDAAHVLAEAAASTRGGGVLVLEDRAHRRDRRRARTRTRPRAARGARRRPAHREPAGCPRRGGGAAPQRARDRRVGRSLHRCERV